MVVRLVNVARSPGRPGKADISTAGRAGHFTIGCCQLYDSMELAAHCAFGGMLCAARLTCSLFSVI